jgi:hypothetical protein
MTSDGIADYQVLDFSSPSNIDQQNFAKQWHRMVMAYVNGLVGQGQTNPVWLRKMVGAIYHMNMYKDNSAPPRCMVVMMPTTEHPAIWSNAVRTAFIDILGGTTMIIYETRNLSVTGAKEEIARTNCLTGIHAQLNKVATELTTLEEVVNTSRDHVGQVNIHMPAECLWCDTKRKSMSISLFNRGIIDQLVILGSCKVMMNPEPHESVHIHHFRDVMSCLVNPDKSFKIPGICFDTNQNDANRTFFVEKHYGWEPKIMTVLSHHTDTWPPVPLL